MCKEVQDLPEAVASVLAATSGSAANAAATDPPAQLSETVERTVLAATVMLGAALQPRCSPELQRSAAALAALLGLPAATARVAFSCARDAAEAAVAQLPPGASGTDLAAAAQDAVGWCLFTGAGPHGWSIAHCAAASGRADTVAAVVDAAVAACEEACASDGADSVVAPHAAAVENLLTSARGPFGATLLHAAAASAVAGRGTGAAEALSMRSAEGVLAWFLSADDSGKTPCAVARGAGGAAGESLDDFTMCAPPPTSLPVHADLQNRDCILS